MGGSSSPNLGPQPAAPQQINYSSLLGQANQGAGQQYADMLKAQMAAYPQMQKLQLGTINQLAGNLNNAYTQQAKGYLDNSVGTGISQLQQSGANINALGNNAAALGNQAYNQTSAALALGGQLSPEQQRNAEQGAAASYASRGLGTGQGAAAAEILGRFNTSNALYQQRLGNAAQAQGMLGNAANLYGQAGSAYQNAGQLGMAGANAYTGLDPYQRALGPGMQLGSGILNNTGSMLGNVYGMQNDLAGNVASYNQNMQGNLYNSWQNNNAALAGSRNAANASMWGAGLGAAGALGGAIGGAVII